MPIPTVITDLSTTILSNYPQGTDEPRGGDDVIRAVSAFTAQLRDGAGSAASVAAHATTCNFWSARSTTLTGAAVTFTNCAAAPYAGYLARVENGQANIWSNGAVFDVQGGADFTAASGDICWVYAKTTTTFKVFIEKTNGKAITADYAAIQSQSYTAFTTSGSGTAYTGAPAPAISAYAAGLSFFATFHAVSGASPTLQVNGLASPPNLVKQNVDGTYSNIAASDIPANHRSRVTLLSTTQALVERLPPTTTDTSGKMDKSANLSDVANATTARSNLGVPSTAGSGASGTWGISISGNAATATTASNGGVTSVNGSTGAVATVSTLNSFNGAVTIVGSNDINVSNAGNVITIARPAAGCSIHGDTLIAMVDGGAKFLRDVRLGDVVAGELGPAKVLGIWRTVLGGRDLCQVDSVACTAGHLFKTRTGWSAWSPAAYRETSYGQTRVMKGLNGLIEVENRTADPDEVQEITIGMELLRIDGYAKVRRLCVASSCKVEGRPLVASDTPVYGLHLDRGSYYFADGLAVSAMA